MCVILFGREQERAESYNDNIISNFDVKCRPAIVVIIIRVPTPLGGLGKKLSCRKETMQLLRGLVLAKI